MDLASITTTHAAARPDREAVVDIDTGARLTWDQLDDRVCRLATGLLDLGLRKGSQLAVFGRNRHEILELYLACAKAGILLVLLNPRLGGIELAQQLDDSEAVGIVVDGRVGDRLSNVTALDELEYVIGIGAGHGLPQDFEQIIGRGQRIASPVQVNPEDPFTLMYTSGTTGTPKGVVLDHYQHALGSLISAASWRITSHYRNVMPLPLTLAGGWNGTTASGIVMGATTVLLSYDPERLAEAMYHEQGTHVPAVPTIVAQLLDVPSIHQRDLPHLRTLSFAGSPMPRHTLERAYERFGSRLLSPYGMTETTCLGSTLLPEDIHLDGDEQAHRRARSVGRPMPFTRMRVVDAHGTDVPADGTTPGEIVISGPTVMRGYWKDPAATESTMVNGWYHTGDVGVHDREGYLTIVDRKKELIITGGMNVSPREVEDALHRHPAVAAVAVAGLPDPTWGETVTAFVRWREPGGDEQGLRHLADQLLGDYKRPKSYIAVDEIPLTALNKVDRKALREPYWREHDRTV